MYLVNSPLAMENCCQLMMAFCVDCVIVTVAPAPPILALPATTVPPVGLPKSGAVCPKSKRKDKPHADAIFRSLTPSSLRSRAVRFMVEGCQVVLSVFLRACTL